VAGEVFVQQLSFRSQRGVLQKPRDVAEIASTYKEGLFTFLNFDEVPWNNNNAEHAIKRFAHYREITDGHLAESGLTDYLVLLSINQTCEYKGISF
jgi:hypothetical protein